MNYKRTMLSVMLSIMTAIGCRAVNGYGHLGACYLLVIDVN